MIRWLRTVLMRRGILAMSVAVATAIAVFVVLWVTQVGSAIGAPASTLTSCSTSNGAGHGNPCKPCHRTGYDGRPCNEQAESDTP